MRYTVALLGAAGKMGSRCTNNLLKADYRLLLCEEGKVSLRELRNKGLEATPAEEAVSCADIIVMAVPDALLGGIAKKIVPMLKKDAVMIVLDPAVPYAGGIPLREDVAYVVTHPCHPSLFREQKTAEARKDLFGGIAAVQDIVIALIQGSKEKFNTAEEVSRKMFAPVDKCYRVTLEQMALLEPALSEVIGATVATIIKEAVDTVVNDYGVPREVAESFISGHIHTELAITLGVIDADLSDACKVAVNLGKDWVFRPDWKKVFKPEMVEKEIEAMLHS